MSESDTDGPAYDYILALADLHCFSAFGLIPTPYIASTGNEIMPNIGQEYLLRVWEHLLRCLPERIDVLFLLGDMIEGINFKEQGRQLSDVDPTWQVRGTADILKPIVDRVPEVDGKRNIYMVAGSLYHAGIGAQLEEQLGEMIGATPKIGRYAPPIWNLLISSVLFEIGHRQAYTIRFRSMPMERELDFKHMRDGIRRGPVANDMVIMRAHAHMGYRCWRERYGMCISVPPMKIQDIFAKSSATPNRWIPDNIGAVGLKVYHEPFDNRYVSDIPYLYEHPDDEPQVVTIRR